jgi:hypothetical protein
VAVVQISRIQVRRGQKNVGSGLPQLASGELGWAIDTRELFIGNGAVSEGAPAVGNTKILTEYDNIFELADTYIYKADESYIVTGENSSNPIQRTLQDRLDDIVTVKSFNVKGDGVQVCTDELQRAIDQLYINDATKGSEASRVVLYIEPGVYKIDGTIFIPPHVTLLGAGSDKTVIQQSNALAIFRTVNSSSTPGTPADDSTSTTLNQATNIRIEGMTLENTTDGKALVLQSCKNSLFRDIKFKGSWSTGSPIAKTHVALEINSLSGTVESSNNRFENCEFIDYAYAVISNWDVEKNHFVGCDFSDLGIGIVFGEDMILGAAATGQSVGPSYNHFESCNFENIERYAMWIKNGTHNTSHGNTYTLVGNDGGVETHPVFPILRFDVKTNESINDYFARTVNLISGSGITSVPYVAEVESTACHTSIYENSITFGQLSNVRLFRLPASAVNNPSVAEETANPSAVAVPQLMNWSYEIHYTMVSENYSVSRSGVMTLTINGYDDTVEMSDDFHFTGDESYLDSVLFNPTINTLTVPSVPSSKLSSLTVPHIDVKVTSTMPVDDQTQLKFTIKAKKTDII